MRITRDGTALPGGEEGEIEAVSADQMLGHADPVKQAASLSPDGYLRTGDIGVLDERGYLTVTDLRMDIICAGETPSSPAIEDVLSGHPGVVEAAAVAMPDDRYGEKVCAFVVLRGDGSLILREVADVLERAGVARQKTPEGGPRGRHGSASHALGQDAQERPAGAAPRREPGAIRRRAMTTRGGQWWT